MTDTDTNFLEQVVDRTKEATSKGTFSLTDALHGRSYPTSKVSLYTDVASIIRLVKINDKLTELAQDKGQNRAEYERVEGLVESTKEKIFASELIIHLRGVAPGVLETLRDKVLAEAEAGEWEQTKVNKVYGYRLIAAHLVKVENADGAVDEREFTEADIEALEDTIPPEQFSLLDKKIHELSFETSYLDQIVDAGFLPTS